MLPISNIQTSPIQAAQQLLITVADHWDSIHGQLIALQRAGDRWSWACKPIAVTLGKHGLQYAQGLVAWDEVSLKKEGDWKTPVGAFTLSGAFGYAPTANFTALPYCAVTEKHKAVDDPKSRYYNQIVRTDIVTEKDWQSAEDMLRQDDLYKWGIVVDFNKNPVVAGSGSCIFMHLWRDANRYTAGCTAMAESDMAFLLRWLRPVPKPVLVQGDRTTLNQLLPQLGLTAALPHLLA